jgi:hypothetical protein
LKRLPTAVMQPLGGTSVPASSKNDTLAELFQ